jgi:hypothetical protein
MKIKEITENFKVTNSSPEKVEISSADGNTKITAPPTAIQQDPSKPNTGMLDLSKVNLGQTGQSQPPQAQGQTPPAGQPAPAGQMGDQQSQAAPEQTPPAGQTPQAAPGQTPPAGQPAPQQQAQLPKVGSEIELPDNIGSTIQSETFDDKKDPDLIASGKNGDIDGDETNDFIKDVTDDDKVYNSGRSQRNVVQPDPIKESEELIAMLTIAGLR